MRKITLLIYVTIIFCFVSSANEIDSLKNSLLSATDKQKAITYNTIARKYLSISIDTGHMYCDSAIFLSTKIKSNDILALSYKNKGIILYYKGLYTEALNFYMKSLSIYESLGDDNGIAANNNNIAIIYQVQGDFEVSIKYHLNALKVWEELNDDNQIALSYTNIGNVYGVMGNHEKAIEYQSKSLKIWEQAKDSIGIGNALNNLGSEYSGMGQYDKAFNYHKRALNIRKNMNDMHGIATSLLNLGLASKNLGNFTEARINMEEALVLTKKLGNKRAQTSVLESLSLTYIELGLNEVALEYLKEAESISNEYNFSVVRKNIYETMAKIYKKLKDTETAYSYFEKYVKLNDSLIHIENTNFISELETKYETEKKIKEIDLLQKENEIQILQNAKQRQQIKGQRTLLAALASSLFLILLLIFFWIKWFKAKQQSIQDKLQLKSLLTEQKMLRSQMDPHFIYNSLNSIQSYISSNQDTQAERYLARFAKLMRGILENSRLDFVLLEKEIELLKIYMELEQLRFNNRFNFEINLTNEVDSDYILIPPMLIQPFLENSIIHGFKNKTNGLLMLNFSIDNDFLYCVVEDNGVGRKSSVEIKENTKKQSLGMEITGERLSTLSEQFNVHAEFKVIDLFSNENGKAKGTRVEIKLPYKEM